MSPISGSGDALVSIAVSTFLKGTEFHNTNIYLRAHSFHNKGRMLCSCSLFYVY
jgi:hypothetical protein